MSPHPCGGAHLYLGANLIQTFAPPITSLYETESLEERGSGKPPEMAAFALTADLSRCTLRIVKKGDCMKLPEGPLTIQEFHDLVRTFISDECEKQGDHLVHKGCGGSIRTGFVNLFYVDEDGSLDPGGDGFGIGPRKVPYCEKHDPPDGFNYAYARRFPIKKTPETTT